MPIKTLILAALATLLLVVQSVPAQLVSKNLRVNGVARQYLVYLPAGYSGSVDLPVMFIFHGGSMTSQSMLQMVDMRPLADRDKVILVYPQGLPGKGGATIWNSVGPYSNGVDEIGFTSAMIDALDLAYAVDQKRVYACGYSNGANLVWELGCFLSQRIAAVGAVAGSMWEWTRNACAPTRPVPVLSIHGTQDSYNPYAGGPPYSLGLIAASDYWVGRVGANPSPRVSRVPDRIPGDGSTVDHFVWADGIGCVAIEHFRVNRGGHDWPGKFGNMDIDASEEIWDFVSRYDLDGRIDTVTQIGVGVGGANIGTLDSLSGPSVGSTVLFQLSGFNGAGMGFAVLSPAAARVPFLGGTAFVDLGNSFGLPTGTAANGVGQLSIRVPNSQNLVGLEFHAQVAIGDLSQIAGVALSNGLSVTLCK